MPIPAPSSFLAPTPGVSPVATESPHSTSTPPSVGPSLDTGLGVLHIETTPAVSDATLTLAYANLAGVVDVVPAGTAVSIDRAFEPGDIGVIANGKSCSDPAHIDAGTEADMVLDVEANGACSLALRYDHAIGAIHHPITGGVFGATAPKGAVVTLRPTNAATGAKPISIVAGPAGVGAMEVPLGAYEVTAVVDGEVIRTREVEFEPGGDIVVDLMGLSKRVPRDCGSFDAAACEAIIDAALSNGLWISPTDVVRSVAIRSTEVVSCDPNLEPEVDAVFEITPSGRINVTVGRTAQGSWMACPPY